MTKTKVEKHFDKVAESYDFYKKKNSFYYDNLKKLLRSLIPPKSDVFEFGCGTGELLASLNPKNGYGFDISKEMIKLAKFKHKPNKNLIFSTELPSTINHQSLVFDYIFMSDVIEHLENPAETFKEISKLMDKNTKYIITMANPIWEPFLMLAEKLRLKMPEGPHKRIKYRDLRSEIEKKGLRIIKHDYTLLIPVKIPLITKFVNKYFEKPLKRLAFIEYLVVVKA